MLMICACEKTEIQKSVSTIEERSDCVDECTDCPIDDCCCAITLTSQNSLNLIFCGVTDPCLSTQACYAEAGNCVISGYELNATVTQASPTQFFCVAKNSPFYILASAAGTARITCQVGQANPQTVNVSFNSDKVYYTADNNCELTSCL